MRYCDSDERTQEGGIQIFMNENELVKEVAEEIVSIMKKSPEHGNTVMDLLGYEKYCEILRIATAD